MQVSIILGLLSSFCLVVVSIPGIIRMAQHKEWLDKPNQRKVHTKPIPVLGGLGIYLGFWIIAFSFFCYIDETNVVLHLWAASWLLFVTSLWDDVYGSGPLFRLFNHIVVGSICYMGGIKIAGFYGLMNIWEVGVFLQYLLTVLAIVTIINAFNLIDGINGLAGSLFLQASIIFSILFWQGGANDWFLITIISVGAILGFLPYNFKSARIFMGDSGSTFLGLLLAVFFMQYLNTTPNGGGDNSLLIIALSIICLPILDLVRVSVGRLIQRKSPFNADQNHIHHLLLIRGKSHQYATIQLVSIQLILFVIGYLLLPYFHSWVIIVTLMFLYLVCILLLRWSMGMTEIKKMEMERLSIGGDYRLS